MDPASFHFLSPGGCDHKNPTACLTHVTYPWPMAPLSLTPSLTWWKEYNSVPSCFSFLSSPKWFTIPINFFHWLPGMWKDYSSEQSPWSENSEARTKKVLIAHLKSSKRSASLRKLLIKLRYNIFYMHMLHAVYLQVMSKINQRDNDTSY